MSKLNEQEVLQQLKVNDFKDISTDKQLELLSLFPQMEQEVVEKALEQCPALVDTLITKAQDDKSSNDDNGKSANESILESLNSMVDELSSLQNHSSCSDDKKTIINLMIEIVNILKQTNRLNQAYLLEKQKSNNYKTATKVLTAIIVLPLLFILFLVCWPVALPITVSIAFKGRKII